MSTVEELQAIKERTKKATRGENEQLKKRLYRALANGRPEPTLKEN